MVLVWVWAKLRQVSNWQWLHRTALESAPNMIVRKVEELGLIRYAVVSGLFLVMFGVPAKMVLRWTLAVKYVWVVPGVINI